jgi:hypothetical protein
VKTLIPMRVRRRAALVAAVAVVAGGLAPVHAQPSAHAEDVWLSVDDGEHVSGAIELTAGDLASSGVVSLTVDGTPLAPTPQVPTVHVVAEVLDYQGGLAGMHNAVLVNGVQVAMPDFSVDSGAWATLTVALPASAFVAGPNTVGFACGSATMVNDPVNNNDDFAIRNVRLEFRDGSSIADPTHNPATELWIGDWGDRPRVGTWTFDVPAPELAPLAADVPDVEVVFDANGFNSGTTGWIKNSVWVNGVKAAEPVIGASWWITVTASLPGHLFHAGANTVEVVTGSLYTHEDPNFNNDDFTFGNLVLFLADGTMLRDPNVPVNREFALGDATPETPRRKTYTIELTPEQALATSHFTWDTTTVAPGPHTVTATSAGGGRSVSAEVIVDQAAPIHLFPWDGGVVTATQQVTAASADGSLEFAVDGVPLDPAAQRSEEVAPVFAFDAGDLDTVNHKNSIWVNDTMLTVLEDVGYVNWGAPVTVSIPWSMLHVGTNSIGVRTGSVTSPTDEATNVDDFIIVMARMEFSGGRVIYDTAHPYHGNVSLGDNNVTPPLYIEEFVFEITEDLRSDWVTRWDTTTLPDGDHTVTVSKPGSSRTASSTVTVDNSGPEVTVHSPAPGAVYRVDPFRIDAEAVDARGVESLELDLDGTPVHLNQEIRADDIRDGAHTLTVTAEDGIGNRRVVLVEFSTVGNYPLAPSVPSPRDGASLVAPETASLSVRVVDPAGDAMDVAVKRAFRSDLGSPGASATQGVSTRAVPGRVAGTAITDVAGLGAADGVTIAQDADGAYPFQQFELPIPDDLAATAYTVDWTGTAPAGGRVALSVWNHDTHSWQTLASGESDGAAPVALSAEAS